MDKRLVIPSVSQVRKDPVDVPEVKQVEEKKPVAVQQPGTDRHLFGEMLVSKGLITRRQLIEALNEQRDHGGRLGEVLIRLKMVSYEAITHALAEYLSIEYIRFEDVAKIDIAIARLLPEALARRFCLVALGEIDGKVIIAMEDPLNVVALDTIAPKIKRPIQVVVSSREEITKAIETIYHGSDIEEQRIRDLVEVEVGRDGAEDQIEQVKEVAEEVSEEEAHKAPVIRFVNLMLSQAVKSRASDIHVEPQERSVSVRMRVDGDLHDMVPPPKAMQNAIITRIKILSDMDIAERRLPQDSRFKMRAGGRDIDVRVSSIPTIYGEKIVMRILDASAVSHDVDKLGFEPELLIEFKTILNQPHGIIVVTGPTGSGKSTTLYATLNYLRDPTKNISTVEDPVEYRLAGINQCQVKSEINLDFASCLRSLMRQDPDIILIGEIRDKETVEVAMKAALTGHLVLTTFHTNDAPSAISRFVYMGIEPFLLASTLNLIIAQRLVRRVCEKCKEPVTLSDEVLNRLKIPPEKAKESIFYRGKGCKACSRTGYRGRLPVFEFLVIDEDIRTMIVSRATEAEVRKASRQKGYGGLMESGISNLLKGITTAEEVLGVTYLENIR